MAEEFRALRRLTPAGKYMKARISLAMLSVGLFLAIFTYEGRSEEDHSAVSQALSSTTITGYVDTSLDWSPMIFGSPQQSFDDFSVTAAIEPIPEPSVFALLAMGSLALLFLGRPSNSTAHSVR